MHKIAHKLAHEMPEHGLVSTTTYALNHPAFELVKRYPAKSLAWTDVFIYRKLGKLGQDEWPDSLGSESAYRPDPEEWELKARQLLAEISPK
jgi:hypothetical protein